MREPLDAVDAELERLDQVRMLGAQLAGRRERLRRRRRSAAPAAAIVLSFWTIVGTDSPGVVNAATVRCPSALDWLAIVSTFDM